MSFETSSSSSESQTPSPGRPVRGSWAALGGILVFAATVVFAALAWIHPFLSTSYIAIVSLSILFLIGTSIVFLHPNRDPLHPLRLAALITLLIYCVAPLITRDIDWYFVHDERILFEQASAFALVAFICLCVGYAIGPSARGRTRVPARRNDLSQSRIALYGLILFGIGFVGYLAAVLLAGGLDRIFSGGEARVQFFKGIGWLYWAAFLMMPGGALYFSAMTAGRVRAKWIAAWPLLTTFAALILLQGRFRAVRGLICLLILWHYRIRPFRMAELATLGAGGFGFFVFVGYARHPDIRPYLLSDPLRVIWEVANNFLEFSQSIIGDTINRLPQIMLALDSFPDRVAYQWGKTFSLGLNPIFRFVGQGGLQTENTGTIFFQLARPEYPTWLETGYHTSLAGELLANFPWYLTPFGFILFGVILRTLYSGLIRRGDSLLYGCLYALVLFPILSMMIVGVGLVLFEIVVVVSPLLLAIPLLRRSTGTPQAQSPAFESAARDEERATGPDALSHVQSRTEDS